MFANKTKVFYTLSLLVLCGGIQDAGSNTATATPVFTDFRDFEESLPQYGFDEGNWRKLPGKFTGVTESEFTPEVLCNYIKSKGMPESLLVTKDQFRDLMISVGGIQGTEFISNNIKDWLGALYCYYMDRPEFQRNRFGDTNKFMFEIDYSFTFSNYIHRKNIKFN